MKMDNEDFTQYCRQCTDPQLEAVLAKEYQAQRADDYTAAKVAAAERGWTVLSGERV